MAHCFPKFYALVCSVVCFLLPSRFTNMKYFWDINFFSSQYSKQIVVLFVFNERVIHLIQYSLLFKQTLLCREARYIFAISFKISCIISLGSCCNMPQQRWGTLKSEGHLKRISALRADFSSYLHTFKSLPVLLTRPLSIL